MMEPDPVASGPEISAAYLIPRSTLRTWLARGRLARRGKDRFGRTLYSVREVEDLIGWSPRAHTGERLGRCVGEGCSLPAVPESPVPVCIPHLTSLVTFAERLGTARLLAV